MILIKLLIALPVIIFYAVFTEVKSLIFYE